MGRIITPSTDIVRGVTRGVAEAFGGGGSAPPGGGGGQTLLFNDPADDDFENTVSGSGRILTRDASGGDFRWGLCDLSASSGKVYFEVVLTTFVTYVTLGFCRSDSTRETAYAGQPNGTSILLYANNLLHYHGADASSYNTIASGFDNPASGQIYTVAIDIDNETTTYYKDGVAFMTDLSITAAAGDYHPFCKTFGTTTVWTIPETVTHAPAGYDLLTA